MNILDVNLMLTELKKLRNECFCQLCNEVCEVPVKIKICGHYFCKNCLQSKNKHIYSCPKCKISYEKQQLDYRNIAVETEPLLTELEKCLINLIDNNPVNESMPEENAHKVYALDSHTDTKLGGKFSFNNKQYVVNFVEKTCNKVNAKGETSLHIACKRKKLNEVNTLLEKNVDINAQDFAGWAPLHEAVESGCLEIVETLLKHGALIDTPGEDYTTPLHKATVSRKSEIIKLLLKYGADKDIIDFFGKKPIEYTEDENILNIFKEKIEPMQRIEQLYCNKKVIAYCYYVEKEYKDKLKERQVKILEQYNPKKVTHFIIRKTHKISLKILVAMLDGCTIVPQEWINNFLNDDMFIPFPTYRFIDNDKLNSGMQKAMVNSLLKFPKLFNGINFFISKHNTFVKIYEVKFTKDYISALITSGGGKLLHRAPSPRTCDELVNFPFHARKSAPKCCNYIIYEENNPPDLRYQMAEIKHRSSHWLVECVVNFTILG